MQNYVVTLKSPVSDSFRCRKAADSLDIDTEKKSVHHFEISCDLWSPFNIGLIVGASGSGKTTLARTIYGRDFEQLILKPELPVIEQFPKEWTYDECASALSGMGLTSVPCWIRPAYTLSNGQRARAEAALQLAQHNKDCVVIDEWTSVVDRTVAKVMSHCVQKHARKQHKRIVLLSCHYDVIDWLNPDWIIDCNKQEYINRRGMVGAHERTDRLRFDIKECSKDTWKYFSKYHYLSDRLPGGKIFTYGLYHGAEQVGFQCFAAYIIGDQNTYFSNRTVIHPDYAGLGLGIKLINETSKDMVRKGYRVRAKFSSLPVYKSMLREPLWRHTATNREILKPKVGKTARTGNREAKLRSKQTTYSFEFTWKNQAG
jgi:ABC-type transport system involved in cytochrome c biogenesis ATPase subunit/GNAT superfamily N-acetyltransferase